MSVHFKVGVPILSKSWKPGGWHASRWEEVQTSDWLQTLANQLFAEVENADNMFLEIDKQYSKVLQLGPYRIVIVYPPLVDTMEITVVRPVKKMSMVDYNLSADLLDHIRNTAQGILVSWAPWEGKTTFAQALAEQYVADNKVVKTLESPRDLLVPDAVSQYSFTYASHDEVRNILLLSRPDNALYDEVRNAEDFVLYADLRLTWIWLVWVTHATKPVDSIQRFIGHVDMGSLPQVIDTVIFIKAWQVNEVLTITQVVKVPAGMNSQDLARPVLQVTSFLTKKILYEIYSFGEQIVVMELAKIKTAWGDNGMNPMQSFAAKYITILVEKNTGIHAKVTVLSDSEVNLEVDSYDMGALIGKWGENIMALEKKLGVKLNVRDIAEWWSKGKNMSDDDWIDDSEDNWNGDRNERYRPAPKPKYRSTRGAKRRR